MASKALVGLVLLATGLAGCVGSAPSTEPVAAAPRLPAVPEGFATACPPGPTFERVPGVCVGTLASLTESLEEPSLALDARRPGVLAVGVNSRHTVNAVGAERPRPGVDDWVLDLYVSEDGGSAWRRAALPYVDAGATSRCFAAAGAVEYTLQADPKLAFDDVGTLHVLGQVTYSAHAAALLGVLGPWCFEVFHVASPDLGRTWGPATVFASEASDLTDVGQSGLAAGEGGVLAATWSVIDLAQPWPQRLAPGAFEGARGLVELAWSTDRGARWQRLQIPDCITASPPLFAGGETLLACAGTGDSRALRVVRLDLASGALEERSRLDLPGGFYPQLGLLPDGALAMAMMDSRSGEHPWTVSRDGGRTWGPVRDLRGLAQRDDGWPRSWLYAFATDPWGAAHALLGGSDVRAAAGDEAVVRDRRVVHLAFDPLDGRALGETLLTPEDTVTERRTPPSASPGTRGAGDHYYGIAFERDHGFLVWTFDKGLDYTHIVPRAAP